MRPEFVETDNRIVNKKGCHPFTRDDILFVYVIQAFGFSLSRLTLHVSRLTRLLHYFQQLHFKYQRSACGDFRTGGIIAIRQVGRNE